MKTEINKSVKRAISLVIAFALLIGTLFTANVGININADAATTETVTEGKTVYLQDSTLTNSGNITGLSLSKFTKDTAGNYIIDTVEKLAYVCLRSFDTANLSFKVADDIDAFVLQTEAYASGIKDLADYSAVKAYFEANTTNRFNWAANSNTSGFRGSFDGNGVAIYGMYADGCLTNYQQPGFFPMVEGGAADGEAFTFGSYSGTHSKTGTTIKNFAIYNSYVKGFRRVGIVIGTDQWTEGGYNVEGFVNLDSCVVGNCYAECVDNYTDASGAAVTTNRNGGEAGLFAGGIGNDPMTATNVLVYGSYGCFKENETDTEITSVLPFIRNNGALTSDDTAVTEKMYGKLYNAVLIDVDFTSFGMSSNAQYVSNVYTNSTINSSYTGVVKLASADVAKGMTGRLNMGGLNWADAAENADDGNTYWYYQENDYPTPIRPASDAWKTLDVPSIWGGSAASEFAGGTGTKEDPYIIKTAEQLYRAVSTITDSTNSVAGGYQSDKILKQDSTTEYVPVYTPYYYKVADGISAIYLNNIYENASLSGIKALVAAGSAKNWAPGKFFVGELDGNGVTIYGMYCSSGTGLVKKLDGAAAVKNFNFDSCYSTGSGNVALVTTELGSYMNDTTLITVANISVRNSYLCSTRDLALSVNDSGTYTYSPSAAGVVSTQNTCENLTILNCLYDGHSCERSVKSTSGEITEAMIGGIISGGHNMNNVTVSGSVSLGAPIVDEVFCSGKEIFYNRYDKNQGFQVYFYNNYTDVTQQITTTYDNKYDKLEDIVRVSEKDAYTMNDMPLLQWNKQWQLKTFDTRTIPMPLGAYAGGGEAIIYSNAIADYLSGIGAVNHSGVNGNYGKYGWISKLNGSGTEEDPFLITTAFELAQAIGSGGKEYHNPYYYKLTCDIDLTGSTWINQTSVGTRYVYVPFEGTIDGAGHTITGLTSVDTDGAGFIPVLNGGTVKNLHFRDCYAGSSGYAGIIAGEVKSGTITGCSVEGSATAGTSSHITGNWGVADVSYSYIYVDGVATYVEANDDTTVTADALDLTATVDGERVWYKAGDNIPRHVNFAKGHSVTDVDGDGVVDAKYVANDIVALRNCLLAEADYANIYGDVNHDGSVNISDLAVIRRETVGTYNSIKDGFWRNVELGKVEIYYDENDNYDFARKLQLYFEGIYDDLGVKKYTAGTVVAGTEAGTPSGDAYVSIKTDTSLTYDQYKIDFDSTNLIVTICGGSFTAVEEAVNEFIQNCDINKANAGVYKTGAKSIDTTVKGRKWVDIDLDGVQDSNEYVYYAWGDEFDDKKQTGSYDTAIWEMRNYKYEETVETAGQSASEVTASSRFHNLTSPAISAIGDLWDVQDGKLTIWRGVNASYDADGVTWEYATGESTGYKSVNFTLDENGKSDFGISVDSEDIYVDPGLIQSAKSMLFKQGYSEMRASLPSDGHAFPAWWFYNGVQETSNNNMTNRTLFSKVYKLNNTTNNTFGTHWDGTNNIDPTNLATYKYQMPQAYLEFDIVEFMQAGSGTQYSQSSNTRTGKTTGDWRDYIQLTIHKYYDQHASGGNLYIPDWSTGGFLEGTNSSGTAWYGMSQATFVNTAGSSNYIHRYDPDTTISKNPYTVEADYPWQDETATSASYSVAQAISNGNLASGKTVTDTFNYGFYWTVNGSTYDLLVFVDMDDDGSMEASELIFKVDETVGHEYDDPTWGNTSASTGSDAHVWNQYAYMLLDNAFYTSNPYGTATRANAFASWGSETGVTMYTDLLAKDTGNGTAGATDKTTFDIEYVRVYQEDGKRDLVTPETEDFNTGNHFGY